jgi:peptide/nickel transport system substrate-binding protein
VDARPSNNVTLRQAVACAIDRQAVLDAAVYGKGKLQTTVLNRGLWSFYDRMVGFSYDLERARSLMAEAGYGNANAENNNAVNIAAIIIILIVFVVYL